MGLRYENLDETTRGFMLKEIDIDDRADTLYRSPWLSQGGQGDWADLLKDAAKTGNDDTLAAALRQGGRIVSHSMRRLPNSGRMTRYQVPVTAPDTMAGEFNNFYCRGLCARAVDERIPRLEVYRARYSANPGRNRSRLLHFSLKPRSF